MRIINGFSELEQNPLEAPSVLAWGNFDGVHLGHQQILMETVEKARQQSGTSVCLTFEPHPAKILHPHSAPKLLQTLDQKREVIEKLGIENFLIQPFDREFSQLEYEVFFQNFILKHLKPSAIRVGCRFSFGYQRRGNMESLAQLCREHQIDFRAIEEFRWQGESVSSSKIRTFLSQGKLLEANQFLDRPYEILAKVVPGDGRGRKLGFPTANLQVENDSIDLF